MWQGLFGRDRLWLDEALCWPLYQGGGDASGLRIKIAIEWGR